MDGHDIIPPFALIFHTNPKQTAYALQQANAEMLTHNTTSNSYFTQAANFLCSLTKCEAAEKLEFARALASLAQALGDTDELDNPKAMTSWGWQAYAARLHSRLTAVRDSPRDPSLRAAAQALFTEWHRLVTNTIDYANGSV